MIKRTLTLITLTVSLMSCGAEDMYNEANLLRGKNASRAYVIICIDNIEYVQTHVGISGHFKQDGSLYTCNQNTD